MVFYSEDCTKCLQEDIKKQQEMVTLSKAMEDKLNAIKGQKMECGCGWNSIKLIWQSVGDNGDCEEIVKVMNKFKEDLQTSGTATVNIQYMPFDANKPLARYLLETFVLIILVWSYYHMMLQEYKYTLAKKTNMMIQQLKYQVIA
jgi:hypothetical protein